MSRTYQWDSLEPATKPTFYFIGVTTGSSSIRKVFPLWAEYLGLGHVEMAGIDLALHAPAEHYRTVVRFLKDDPLSLGALVTTHKLDLYSAARDLFDDVDPLAELMDEVSCLSKRDGRFRAHAKDPITAGHALDAFIPAGYFVENPSAEVLVFGAGGSAIAIDWYLSRPERGSDRPARLVVTNRSEPRLQTLRAVHAASGTDTELVTRLCPTPPDNDEVLGKAPPASVVINATGLGKDAPGSPLTFDGRFPEHAIAWELNYRGNLVFLDQANAQPPSAGVTVVDGWVYFIHGWTQVIAEVFDIEISPSGPAFDELVAIAESTR
ncbi:shikimate dehydrogenase [Microbacterium trichothecenolyticum]|uniref:shikimate dehydrogenase family protein n=1 Tax=Microbacterium trichothecenolyticum TaxID=69370 RepID=UPI001C6F04D6|nr:shikimate dehydrogenase [Microbacterium trichothecenolyticum]MBW9122426.1 shikimate dehydrogenase [Microbacterium trichothecenolyticum]